MWTQQGHVAAVFVRALHPLPFYLLPVGYELSLTFYGLPIIRLSHKMHTNVESPDIVRIPPHRTSLKPSLRAL